MNDINPGDNAEMDIAMNTLLEAVSDVCPELPEGLLREVFLIQKKHVFTTDRSIPMQEMQKCLEVYVSSKIEK